MKPTRYHFILKPTLCISDILLISISLLISYSFLQSSNILFPEKSFEKSILISTILWFLCTNITGLYRTNTITKSHLINRATWLSLALYFLLFALLCYFHLLINSVPFLITFYSLTTVGFLLSRVTEASIENGLFERFRTRRVVAILGKNNGGVQFAAYLKNQKHYTFHGFLDDLSPNFVFENNTETFNELFFEAARNDINYIYVSLEPHNMAYMQLLSGEAEKHCIRLKFLPNVYAGGALKFNNMGSFTILTTRNEPLENIQNRFAKRLFDIIFSSLIILFLLSWIYPVLAMIIKIQSEGSVLFKQVRSGRNNQPFKCYKFRCIQMGHEINGKLAAKKNDRTMPIGKFMRKTGLDLLPQFFNVLRGDMSIVGPHPHKIQHTEKYGISIEKYMVRQLLKPGITGWAQVNGLKEQAQRKDEMKKRIEHDLFYIENWSEMLDLKIIFLTIINMIKGKKMAVKTLSVYLNPQ